MAGTAGSAGRAIKLAVALAMLLSVLAAPATTSTVAAEEPGGGGEPAARAIEPFELVMVEGGGILQLRDFEPYELEQPTSISGNQDDESGVISGGTFSTPDVAFEQDMGGTPVFLDAAFDQVTPGNLTGTVDPEGNVFFSVSLTVTLDIDVGPGAIVATCRSTPVNLQLQSTAPYDPETGLVTVAAPNFTAPPVVADGECSSLVVGPINEQLAGSGHALTLTLQGDLVVPPPPGCPTVVALAADPAEGSDLGDEVALAATVTADPEAAGAPECEDAEGVTPAGVVDFLDGPRVVGAAELADGVAELTTADLPAGTRTLVARYRGLAPYAGGASPGLSYSVAATPAFVVDLPASVEIAGGPVEFDVAAINTGLGGPIANARVEVTLQRVNSSLPLTPVGGEPRVTLHTVDGDDATPVALTPSGTGVNQRLDGSLGPAGGVPLAPGEQIAERLRVAVPQVGTPSPTACGAANQTCPGPLRVTFRLVRVDPATGDVQAELASTSGVTQLVEAIRRPSQFLNNLPPAIAGDQVRPGVARQGTTVSVQNLALGPTVPARPTGEIEVLLDGRPVDIVQGQRAVTVGYQPRIVSATGLDFGGQNAIQFVVPPDMPPGERSIIVRYLGNSTYLPTTYEDSVLVLPGAGISYECTYVGLSINPVERHAAVNVQVSADLPAALPAGATVDTGRIDLRLVTDRGPASIAFGNIPAGETDVDPDGSLAEVSFELGPEGGGTAVGTERTGGSAMVTRDPANPDQIIRLRGSAGAVTVDGTPGDVVPITLDTIRIVTVGTGAPVRLNCTPTGDAAVLGQVTVAGTSLTVDPTGTVRQGRPVTLGAEVAPAANSGFVEFLDVTDPDAPITVGFTTVSGGAASVVVTDLPLGDRELVARYLGGITVPSTTSAAVPLTVLVATECAEFAQPGNGAVVRLVFLELLGRCPDAGGFAHWVGRLDGGLSPEVFANTIARTNEALGRVVDDGYATMLDRAPDAGGRAFWVGRLGGTGRYDQLLADLASSNEFWVAAGSTNDGFVTLVYERILGRAPDPGGLAHWTGQLNAGVPRGRLVSTLARLDEPLGRIVDGSYAQILSRAPSGGERSGSIANLRATGNRSALYAVLIGTSEFFDRAQSFPNPED